jgi:hypothetical protein
MVPVCVSAAFSGASLTKAPEESTIVPEMEPFVTWDNRSIGNSTSKRANNRAIGLILK